jgi:cardiolipin synthase A/B
VNHAQLLAMLITFAHLVLAVGVSAHIVLTKDDVRAAIGWVGLVWLAPVVGSVLYLFLGVNRITRQAHRMRGRLGLTDEDRAQTVRMRTEAAAAGPIPDRVPAELHALAQLVGKVTRQPMADGCAIDILVNGDEAYPAMLAAIDGATRSVAFATYIFDHGVAGSQFVEALARATARGVAVRVLIDGVGARYSHPPILRALRKRGVPVAYFLPLHIPLPQPYANLRNHRKILVVDGTVGFCGGLNVRDSCLLALHSPDATRDVHFRVRGPVVSHVLDAFVFDWAFTTRERLEGSAWAAAATAAGSIAARGIPDGPDANFETLLMTIMGALSQARRSVRIVSPYFLPDAPLVDALRVAALRGVEIEILVPERGNLRLVTWACMAQIAHVLAWGCKVFLSPLPFDHSKLLVVDDTWSLIGSANWDPRSLRLNFEYNIECYSADLAQRLNALIDSKIAESRVLRLEDVEQRPILKRVRDGAAWLAQPYL